MSKFRGTPRFFSTQTLHAGDRKIYYVGEGQGRFGFILLNASKGAAGATLTMAFNTGKDRTISWRLAPARTGICFIAPEILDRATELHLETDASAAKARGFVVTTRHVRLLRFLLWAMTRERHSNPLARTSCQFIGEHPLFLNLRDIFRHRLKVAQSTGAHFQHVIDTAAAQDRLEPPKSCGHNEGSLISFVVPVYNTKINYLDDLLASFRLQPPGFCDLVLSDDGSTAPQTLTWLADHAGEPGVTIVQSQNNAGIAAATNRGISSATGQWIGFVDHDDALAPFAVRQIAKALDEHPGCQFLYTDEVITDKDLRPTGYFLKPAWDPVLLSGVNYINHMSIYRRDRLLEIGGLREGFPGSQDYDLLLRYTSQLKPAQILHLPFPAYLWRRDGKSYSVRFLQTATASARRALAESYSLSHRPAVVDEALTPDLHRVRFDLMRSSWPLVSVIIPSRNAFPLISRILEDLTLKTDYVSLEIIVIDNGSTDPEVLALYENYRRRGISFTAHVEAEPFNFSRSVNRGISMAKGDFILLINNDIEIVKSDWLKEMVACFDYPGTGIVGAKLLYPDRTIQHVGVIAGLGGLAGHWFLGCEEDFPGPMGVLRVRLSLSVVTGACMLISRACLENTGAFDADIFGIAYNDVDFCLRAIKQGYRVVWTPFAMLIHHESASRGSDETPLTIDRFRKDKQNLQSRHHTHEFEDRAFNPWYSKDHSYPRPIMLDRLPGAR